MEAVNKVIRDTAPTVNGAVIIAVNPHALGGTQVTTGSKIRASNGKFPRKISLAVAWCRIRHDNGHGL